MKILYTLTLMILSLTFCDARETYIVFGSGGGFTGQVTAFKLYKNGKILKGTGKAEVTYHEYAKLKKSVAKNVFNELNNENFVSFREPGNMYYFISYTYKKKEVNYTWGASSFDPPELLQGIFHRLMSEVSALKFRKIK
ncbi:MAG: hypothetical protein JXB00_01510 [Bacteroidales bacterium]|nr:hypothetical protein [Bacteroidales bacterium]